MFTTQYAKVIDSTDPYKKTREMVGQIYEVKIIEFDTFKISLYTKFKKDSYWFKLSDVIPATEEEYKTQFENKGEIEEINLDGYFSQKDLAKKVNELTRVVNELVNKIK